MFGIDRRLIVNFDWKIFILAIIITSIGILTIYSANYGFDSSESVFYIKRQIMWLLISIFVMVLFTTFDYKSLEDYTIHIYIINLILLIAVLLIGKKTMGAQRWLAIGGFSFQPSELFKFTTILLVAKFFSKDDFLHKYTIFEITKVIIMVIIPTFLIIKQPDLGTGMLILFVFGTLILFVGIKFSSLVKLIFTVIICIPIGWTFLKPYQKNRLLTFIFPENDPLGAGYHIAQSKIAIGSGKLLGKGFLQGTQNKLNFLPEEHTDFIFSVFAEEWGFIGCVVLIFLYFLFFTSIINVSLKARDNFGAIIAIGVMSIFLWQFFINIGMVIGILPVVGIPLEMISYGGTSLVVSYALLGIVLNVSMRRHLF